MELEHNRGLVHVVDDDPSFRKAMERRLRQAGYMVATHASAQQLLDNMPGDSEPSCILLDVRLPGLDGPALQARLAELGSTLPIIFLSGYADIPVAVGTMKAGAHDFLTKPVASNELLRAIEQAFAHHQASREQQIALDGIRARIAKLTPRERQVFGLVVTGKQNKEVALVLGATVRTIKAHRRQVMEKMQASTVAELVVLAERVGAASDTD